MQILKENLSNNYFNSWKQSYEHCNYQDQGMLTCLNKVFYGTLEEEEEKELTDEVELSV